MGDVKLACVAHRFLDSQVLGLSWLAIDHEVWPSTLVDDLLHAREAVVE